MLSHSPAWPFGPMLLQTSATARSAGLGSGKTCPPFVTSRALVSGLAPFSAPQTSCNAGPAHRLWRCRRQRLVWANAAAVVVVRSHGCFVLTGKNGGRAHVRARLIEGAIAAQHCCIVCEPGEQLRPTRRCSRRAKSGARLNSSIVGRHYRRSLTSVFGVASFAVLAVAGVVSRANVAGSICYCS